MLTLAFYNVMLENVNIKPIPFEQLGKCHENKRY